MTKSATEELLVSKKPIQTCPETDGEATVVEFAPTKGITLLRTTCVLPGQDNVAPAQSFQPVESTTAEAPASPGNIRGSDLFFIARNTYVGWTILCFVSGLVVAFLYFAMGNRTDLEAIATATSWDFYFTQISVASFYLALLLAMRRVLRKRRGRGSFASYFRPIGGRRLLFAALSGVISFPVVVLLISVLWSAIHWHYQPSAGEIMAQPHSLGQLAMLGLTRVVLAPLSEELFFRGLMLEWFQQRLTPLLAALITAAIFGLCHLRFLEYPGIVGWIATAVIAAMGFLWGLWAQRTHSLQAPTAAHATYNATLTLLFGN